MKEIFDNYLLFSKKTNLTQAWIKPYWEKIQMMLNVNIGECPQIVFTDNEDKWKFHADGDNSKMRAFYDESNSAFVFRAKEHLINSKRIEKYLSVQVVDYVSNLVSEKSSLCNYKYIVPVMDIYHEMFHHVQYMSGNWQFDVLLESSADIFTYFLTGHYTDDYEKEMTALWYIGRKMLLLKPHEFYIFVRNSLVDSEFYIEYFYQNPRIVKQLANEYGGNVENLFKKMLLLGNKKHTQAMKRDLSRIHNKLFYKW